MKRPNKKDYNFNDIFEGVRFAIDMIKYSEHLESKILAMSSNVLTSNKLCYDVGFNDGVKAVSNDILN